MTTIVADEIETTPTAAEQQTARSQANDTASACNCPYHAPQRKNSTVEFNVLSDNGIVRMDMSKIIDRTGLPTYDAAIKLESFGYV